jgi:murein DD-endopeptidase MepM/ murein hydrolase activator NlpD
MLRMSRVSWGARTSLAALAAAGLLAPIAAVAAQPDATSFPPHLEASAALPTRGDQPPSDTLDLQDVEIAAEALMPPVAHDQFAVGPPPVDSSVAGLGVISIPAAVTIAWPVVDPTISSPFGSRDAPCGGCSTFHDGVDYTPGVGTPVMAIADGTVTLVIEGDEGLGTHIEVQHNVDGRVLTSTYGHLESGSPLVFVGQAVAAGQSIGRVGSTGQSTGPHLHLELSTADGIRFDADEWLRQRLPW